ncbi:MAG: hypothetical protein ACRDN6_06770 [Gaiellaceae bacterium]
MNLRALIPIVVTLAVLGGAAAAHAAGAPHATSAPQQRCGTHKVVFKSGFITVQVAWRVSATGVSCGDAVKIVRMLAKKPLPSNRAPFPGTYAGLPCTGTEQWVIGGRAVLAVESEISPEPA